MVGVLGGGITGAFVPMSGAAAAGVRGITGAAVPAAPAPTVLGRVDVGVLAGVPKGVLSSAPPQARAHKLNATAHALPLLAARELDLAEDTVSS